MTPDAGPCVLVLAGGAPWEGQVLGELEHAGIVVARRCVDVPDLMAAAATGAASVAVVAGEVPQLDADVVAHLLRYDVRAVGVAPDPATAERLARIGVLESTSSTELDVVGAVLRIAVRDLLPEAEVPGTEDEPEPGTAGRVVAVWGPGGAPGRTTVAVGLAAELAEAHRPVVLVDADPYGGDVAQVLGVLDEISGLLAVARMANLGTLDAITFTRSCRRVGDRLDVLTGLPRADRRVEVRPGALERVLAVAAAFGDVVVDTGPWLEEPDAPLSRDRMTLDAVTTADEVVVVGTAEPSGLARLARGLVELGDVAPGAPVRVVVNRMRPSLGWSERDVAGMVEGYVRPLGVHFLPEDRATVDRALVIGRSLAEVGDSRLRSALAEVASALCRTPVAGQAPNSR